MAVGCISLLVALWMAPGRARCRGDALECVCWPTRRTIQYAGPGDGVLNAARRQPRFARGVHGTVAGVLIGRRGLCGPWVTPSASRVVYRFRVSGICYSSDAGRWIRSRSGHQRDLSLDGPGEVRAYCTEGVWRVVCNVPGDVIEIGPFVEEADAQRLVHEIGRWYTGLRVVAGTVSNSPSV